MRNKILLFIIAGFASICSGSDLDLDLVKSAAQGNLVKVIQYVQEGANIYHETYNSIIQETGNALWYAVYCDKINVVEYLISKKQDINKFSDEVQHSPLHVAVRNNNIDMVALLLNSGADINKEDRSGLTAYTLANTTLWPHHKEMVRLFEKYNDYLNYKKEEPSYLTDSNFLVLNNLKNINDLANIVTDYSKEISFKYFLTLQETYNQKQKPSRSSCMPSCSIQ